MLGDNKISKRILTVLIGVAVLSTGWSVYRTGDLEGAALNFGTEMAGAVVTYWLLTIVLGTQEKKEDLIAQMGSSVKDTAVSAVDALRKNGWLEDGSLKNANLRRANLEGANLEGALLEGANLEGANFGMQSFAMQFYGVQGFAMHFLRVQTLRVHI